MASEPNLRSESGYSKISRRLRAALTIPFVARWQLRKKSDLDVETRATSDSTLPFFTFEEDTRGEVNLYPIYIETDNENFSSTQESSEPTESSMSSSSTTPSPPQTTSTKTTIQGKSRTNGNYDTSTKVTVGELGKTPRQRPTETTSCMLGVLKCLGSCIADFINEKVLTSVQKWLYSHCCRRIRIALIGFLSVFWGVLQCALCSSALIVIAFGDLGFILKEIGGLNEWSDATVTTFIACLLVLHVAQVIFGSLLIRASEETECRSPERKELRAERYLLKFLAYVNINPMPTSTTTSPVTSESELPTTSSDEDYQRHKREGGHQSSVGKSKETRQNLQSLTDAPLRGPNQLKSETSRMKKKQVPSRCRASGEQQKKRCPSPVPEKLLPWLYTAGVTVALYALLASELKKIDQDVAAALIFSLGVPAVACIQDVFAELRGLPQNCDCEECRASSENEKIRNNRDLHRRSGHLTSESSISTDTANNETRPLIS